MFNLMLTGLMGGRVTLDALVGDLQRLCVVESDGSIGISDTTRICGGEHAQDQLNILITASRVALAYTHSRKFSDFA